MAAQPIPVTDLAAANRANAQLSTGPRSPSGKERSRLNACKHGLYAKLLVLPGEDQAQFDAARRRLIACHHPQSESEIALVDLLHETQWRLHRATAIENNLLTAATHQQWETVEQQFGPADPDTLHGIAQAFAFRENARVLAQIARQESRLQRLCDRTLAELVRIANDRQSPPQPPTPAKSRPEAPAASQSGFVPPISTEGMPRFTGPLADIKRKQWLRQQVTRLALK